MPHIFQSIHFATCEKAGKIFTDLCRLSTNGWTPSDNTERERFGLFAIKPGDPIKEGWVNLHLLLWRQFIGMLVGIEKEGYKFNAEQVWAQAWKRMKAKADVLQEKANAILRRAVSRGEEPPDMEKRSNPLEPLAKWTEDGTLEWDKDLCKEVTRLAGDPS